ncbi:phage tail tape measure protein [Escherichia coli]|nr:phage tail tape measure protein [Escherichia coli]WHH43942.1 phage tail tape measure protein [Escherichia coli]WHH88972.1 phage tail tape measure protein [Escherichia coli]
MIDVLGPEKRRRRTTQEKIAIVQQSFEPGMTVSLVARQHGVAASQLFLWRKQYQEGSLTAVAAGEQVVPASELAAAMKQIKELQRLLGKKTMENELLKEAVEYGRAKKVDTVLSEKQQKLMQQLSTRLERLNESRTRGEADRVAKVMADNLDGDLKNLDSAWEGLRIRISDLVDGPLRSVTQWLTRVLEKITSLAQAHPVLTRQLLIAGGALLAMTATIGSLSLVIGVLYGKLATLRLGFDILTRSMNVVRVLPALWGMVTGSVSLLGGAIGALFSPVGLIVAALAGAAVLIWKYWDPIRAFFAGVFSGIMERLTPLRETFERFGPVFDTIGSGISQVFNWFKSLLSPMESSKETLDKCTSAGEIFGNVLGGALQLVLTPAKMLLDTLAWILEKLGVLPDEAERARKKIEDAQRAAILQDKVALLQGDLAKINPPKPVENGNGTGGNKPKDNKPLTDSNTGTLRRLSKIADNTGKLVDETKKRIGPGDIVFKNLPRALAVRGEWQERKIAQVSKPAPAINITPVVPAPLPPALVPVVAASSRPVAEAIRSPVASVPVTSRNREPVASGFGGEIHVHLHNVVTQNPRELAKLVGEMVRAEMERRARAGRGSFYDKD